MVFIEVGMIIVERRSSAMKNSLAWVNSNVNVLYFNWIVQYGGRITDGWDIEFDRDEDATLFLLRWS